MLVSFCLRLAWGLIACTLFLPAAVVPPRFFRVQYLATLGLLAVAAFFLREQGDWAVWLSLGGAAALAFAGSVIWHLDGAPGGRSLGFLSGAALSAALVFGGAAAREDVRPAAGPPSTHGAEAWAIADDFAAGAVLGSATTAMLMGHSYLIAPAMSLTPLFRLLAALGVSLTMRAALAAVGLWLWTRGSGTANLEGEMLLWLPARWILGVLAPFFLGWMAWETARIRSTQSATGILYVVTIVCFLGELTSQLLVSRTGYFL
ncbi:MAG: hypothetical protein U0793_18195 [Gemmataceae bacterium]